LSVLPYTSNDDAKTSLEFVSTHDFITLNVPLTFVSNVSFGFS